MEDVDYDDMEELMFQEKAYLNEELIKLNGGIQPELDSSGYLSLFKDDEGHGLSIQAVSNMNHLYKPYIVGSHSYLILYNNLVNVLRPPCSTFTPQQVYDWYRAIKTIFSEMRRK